MHGTIFESYNVIWNSPSKDHNGSMPLGNGETGINFWVEKSGYLYLLISRTDSWDELNRLCKLGRVKIKLFPEISSDSTYKQTLDLYNGIAEIEYQNPEVSRKVKIWVDANHQVIRIQVESSIEFEPQIVSEIWRTEKRLIQGNESEYIGEHPTEKYSYPDKIVSQNLASNEICWYHQNPESAYPLSLKNQFLEDYLSKKEDPLLNRIFGISIIGEDLISQLDEKNQPTLLSTKANKDFQINIYTYTEPNSNEKQWVSHIHNQSSEISQIPLKIALETHKKWWHEYWERSWIRVSSPSDKNAEELSKLYILQKWIQACGARGGFPVKFNGSIFTVNTKYDPDYRRWGGNYWFQNTRLVYWPMLSGGDWDMMFPFFSLYSNIKDLAEFRNKVYFNHPGWFFPETMTFWGTYTNENFGWISDLEKNSRKPGDPITNEYIRWHYNGTLEFLALMMDYYEFTDDQEFLKLRLLPMAEDLLTWWDNHYEVNLEGKMVIDPSQALETWWNVKNPTPDIAGLQYIVNYFDKKQDKCDYSKNFRSLIQNLKPKIPEIPLKKKLCSTVISPAEKTRRKRTNVENPELYTIFPFKLYGILSNPRDLKIAQNTFKKRTTKVEFGWAQDETQAAHLGLTDNAKSILTKRGLNQNKNSRFPAFWGPNYDWIPDQDHGSNLLMGMQYMLLQWKDDKIILLPAWPKDWDVQFKLWAPHQTSIECFVKDGKIKSLKVNPESRRKDIILGNKMYEEVIK